MSLSSDCGGNRTDDTFREGAHMYHADQVKRPTGHAQIRRFIRETSSRLRKPFCEDSIFFVASGTQCAVQGPKPQITFVLIEAFDLAEAALSLDCDSKQHL